MSKENFSVPSNWKAKKGANRSWLTSLDEFLERGFREGLCSLDCHIDSIDINSRFGSINLQQELCTAKGELDLFLPLIKTVEIPALDKKFLMLKKILFYGGISGLKIAKVNDNLNKWFWDKDEYIVQATIFCRQLTQPKSNLEICRYARVQAKEMYFGQVLYMLLLQGEGQKGELLTDGFPNVFYLNDRNGILRQIIMYWLNGGWYLDAGVINDAYEFNKGCRFFFCIE